MSADYHVWKKTLSLTPYEVWSRRELLTARVAAKWRRRKTRGLTEAEYDEGAAELAELVVLDARWDELAAAVFA